MLERATAAMNRMRTFRRPSQRAALDPRDDPGAVAPDVGGCDIAGRGALRKDPPAFELGDSIPAGAQRREAQHRPDAIFLPAGQHHTPIAEPLAMGLSRAAIKRRRPIGTQRRDVVTVDSQFWERILSKIALPWGRMSAEAVHSSKRASVRVARVQWLAPLMAAQTVAIGILGYSVSELGAKTERLSRTAALDAAFSSAPTGEVAAPSAGLRLDDIRGIIREEIAQLGAQAPGQTKTPDARREPGAASFPAAAPGAASRVSQELDAHIARGRMTNIEIEKFLTKAAELPPAERERMMRKFQAAINSGKLDARL